MQNKTNLGASLGALLAGHYDPLSAIQGAKDRATVENLQAEAELNRAKMTEQQAKGRIAQRQADLNPGDIAAGNMGIGGTLAKQLEYFATHDGDYGNGSMTVDNNLPDGTRNLANSSREEFIKPEGWDDNLAKKYLQQRAMINYGVSMDEKNPENIAKALGTQRDNNFMEGAGNDPLAYAEHSAAVKGDPAKVTESDMLLKLKNAALNGASKQDLENIARFFVLKDGKSEYDFTANGIGNKIDGSLTPLPEGTGDTKKDLIWDAERGVLVDPRTHQAVSVTGVDGKPLPPKSNEAKPLSETAKLNDDLKNGRITQEQYNNAIAGINFKPLNDSQSKALLFGSRMRAANDILQKLHEEGIDASNIGSRTPIIGDVVNYFSSPQKQQLDQAKRDFINATLRRESGASIAPSEFENGDKQYFPQIGDSEAVIEQKRLNREMAMNGILMEVPQGQRDNLMPKAPVAPPPAPAPTYPTPTKEANNFLRNNPTAANRAFYDKKYGAGMAKKLLGK